MLNESKFLWRASLFFTPGECPMSWWRLWGRSQYGAESRIYGIRRARRLSSSGWEIFPAIWINWRLQRDGEGATTPIQTQHSVPIESSFFFSLSSLPAQLFLFFFFLHYCPPPSDFFFLIPVLFRGEDSCCFWLEWKPSDRELHLSSWYPSPRLRMVNSSMAGRKKKQQNNLYFRAWKISGSFIYFYLFILFLFPSILVLLSNFLSLQ